MKRVDKIDTYITKKWSLLGKWNTSRYIQYRLHEAEPDESARYVAAAHLLQYLPTSAFGGHVDSEILQLFRILRRDDFVSKIKSSVFRPNSPRPDKKRSKN